MENYSSLGTLINRPVRYVWVDFAQIQLMETRKKKSYLIQVYTHFGGCFLGALCCLKLRYFCIWPNVRSWTLVLSK